MENFIDFLPIFEVDFGGTDINIDVVFDEKVFDTVTRHIRGKVVSDLFAWLLEAGFDKS